MVYWKKFQSFIDLGVISSSKKNYEMRKGQRAKERFPCNFQVVIDGSVICKAFDVSEGGIYVNTTHCFNPGSVVNISIRSGDEKIECKARVKHCQEGIGMGLMFIDLDDILKKRIGGLIGSIKK